MKKHDHRKTVHELVDHLLDQEKKAKRGGRCPRWFPRLLTIPRFLDHMARRKEGKKHIIGEPCAVEEGKEYVTGEPYGMDSELVRNLIRFCDKHGFDFHIGAGSTYYPGATVIVRIFPKDT